MSKHDRSNKAAKRDKMHRRRWLLALSIFGGGILIIAIVVVLSAWYTVFYRSWAAMRSTEDAPDRQGIVTAFFTGFRDQGLSAYLNAQAIAASETRMWRAYYEGDHVTVGIECMGLLRSQFGLSYQNALLAGRDLARAAQTFVGLTVDYDTHVLPHLVEAYTRIRTAVGESWDPEEVARAELAWWIARRTPGQNDPESVGHLIAYQYELLNSETNPDLEHAALVRAQAAHLRDQGGRRADWPRIEEMLTESYTALLRGSQTRIQIHVNERS